MSWQRNRCMGLLNILEHEDSEGRVSLICNIRLENRRYRQIYQEIAELIKNQLPNCKIYIDGIELEFVYNSRRFIVKRPAKRKKVKHESPVRVNQGVNGSRLLNLVRRS